MHRSGVISVVLTLAALFHSIPLFPVACRTDGLSSARRYIAYREGGYRRGLATIMSLLSWQVRVSVLTLDLFLLSVGIASASLELGSELRSWCLRRDHCCSMSFVRNRLDLLASKMATNM